MKSSIAQNPTRSGVGRGMDGFLRSICGRLPSRADWLAVFNVAVFVVFGWSVRGFLFKIPAFTLYFGLGDNILILFYMLAFALLECMTVMIGLAAVSMLLPSRVLREGFAYKGFIIILVATVAFILYQSYYEQIEFYDRLVHHDASFIWPILVGLVVFAVILAVLFWVFQRWPRLQKPTLILMNQFEIFSYLYVPLGIIGLFLIIVRNAF
jgi:hypothetical protein